MNKFKSAVLIFSIVVEIAAIILFLNKEISSTLFALVSMSMAINVGLYFYQKNAKT